MIFKLVKTQSTAYSTFRGGTTLIGDPSGKDDKKNFSEKEINKNIISIKKVFNKILNTTNKKTKPLFVNSTSGSQN